MSAGTRARRSCWSPTTWPPSSSLCHRAMLLHEGELQYIGEPEEPRCATTASISPSTETMPRRPSPSRDSALDAQCPADREPRCATAPARRSRTSNRGSRSRSTSVVEAKRPLPDPVLTLHGAQRGRSGHRLGDPRAETAGGRRERIRLAGEIENPLVAGRYYLDCWVREHQQPSLLAIQALPAPALRGLRHRSTPRRRDVCRATSSRGLETAGPMTEEAAGAAATFRAVRAGRRPPALAGAALT